MVLGGATTHLNDHVAAMWSQLSGPITPIPAPVIRERIKKRAIGIPAGVMGEGDRLVE